jgi:alpha-beta hydrolase superfamily lysophospholipase
VIALSCCAVFLRLAAAGIGIYTYDAFGHGLSEPKDEKHRSYIENFNYLVK